MVTKTAAHGDFRLSGHRVNAFTLVSSTLAITTLSLALPVATSQIYDRILPNQSTSTLIVLTSGVAVVILLEATLRLARAYLLGFAGAAYVHQLSCEAMRHVLAADTARSGDPASRIDFQNLGAIRNLKDFNNGYALTTLIELVLAPIFLALIAYIGGWVALAPTALLIAFSVFSLWNGYALKERLSDRDESDDRRYDFLIGALTRSHSVKAFAKEQYLLRRYEAQQSDSCAANFAVSNAMSSSFNTTAVFGNLMIVATVGFGALAVVDDRLTTGALIAIVILSGRIMQPVQRALMLWSRYQGYKIAKEKTERLFATPVVQQDTASVIPEPAGALDIEALSFGYAKDGPPLFEGLNLCLRKGEAVSITGPSGAGKTTLLKLIAGLHRPSSGRVMIAGLDATRFPPRQLNKHIGFMATEGAIFRGTIKDNITRFGDVSIAEAMRVAALLGMDKELAKLPAGLDTKLEGTGADSIPPGVKQRISLIRALATRPPLLLFDNSDRALDLDGYGRIHSLLGRLKLKTAMVIVSDDENLRQIADRHVEIQGGRLYGLDAGLSATQSLRSGRR